MLAIRRYRDADAEGIGTLIADTFGDYNLDFLLTEERGPYLGPFRHARSPEKAHKEAIAQIIEAEMMLVAEDDGEIVGVLRGKPGRLQSLFVRGDHHRQGIGRKLVDLFEAECLGAGAMEVHLAASLHAVPFYTKVGYKKAAGVQSMDCFEGKDFPYQPMRKFLASS